MTLNKAQDDANLAWSNSVFAEQAVIAEDDARAWEDSIDTEALAEHDYAIADDAATAADAQATATAENAAMIAQAAADGNFESAAAANAAYEVSLLAGALQSPWGDFENALAQATSTWTATKVADEEAYVASVASNEIIYATADASQILSETRQGQINGSGGQVQILRQPCY